MPNKLTRFCFNYCFITHLFLHQRTGHRGVYGDVIFGIKDLIIADYTEAFLVAFVIFNFYPGAKQYFAFLKG